MDNDDFGSAKKIFFKILKITKPHCELYEEKINKWDSNIKWFLNKKNLSNVKFYLLYEKKCQHINHKSKIPENINSQHHAIFVEVQKRG
jgi:hypothetical protein